MLKLLGNRGKLEFDFRSSSSSSSDGEERTEFITSFGDEGENSGGKTNTDEFLDEDERNVVHGPALPSAEFRRIL